MKTPMLIEQHFHGAFGVDFNKSKAEDIIILSKKLYNLGICGFFPTLVTDSIENIKNQVLEIKKAAAECHNILGIHLEGIFLNPDKKGIHNSEKFLNLTEENYKKIEDDFIKIVTLAPELDDGLIKYLKSKNVKIQAGHCTGWINGNFVPNGVTHIYNAMPEITHRGISPVLKALLNDDIYTEIICDGIHVSDDALKLLFKTKPIDKIILISDSLPITYSNQKESIFADSKIFYDGFKATSEYGTIAGSTKLLPEIIKVLGQKGLFNPKYVENVYKYHNIEPKQWLIWDEEFNIIGTEG